MFISFYKDIKEKSVLYILKTISLTLIVFVLMASDGYSTSSVQKSSNGNLTLKLVSATMKESLASLSYKAGCAINYNKGIFQTDARISLDLKDVSLIQALRAILENTRVSFRLIDAKTVILYKLPDPPKPGRIAGKILDEKGETLPGAAIKVLETGNSIQSNVDGAYVITLPPGTYTLEISYLSYQTQRVTGIVVDDGKSTSLNVALKPAPASLKEVVVSATYRKASAEGLLARQKNAAEVSNGISADQISRTPDRNIGESLKRISGVSTVDNKFVLIRGIGERYNSALLDGVVLPSTEAQSRNFSFDLIPSNLVDNVVVSKTVTPDMNASFGGGLIQINTKDIPNENFMSFTAGTSYNDQSTGKEFLSHKRGKHDYLGFDDGRRDFPTGLFQTARIGENAGLSDDAYWAKITAQSKRFTNDNFTLYRYKAAPSQNYQFTLGRLISLDTVNQNKLGFTGAISYRNFQNINNINTQIRGDWGDASSNTGHTYAFNTTWGALLNVGLQLGKNKFSSRNTYTRIFENALMRIIGDDGNGDNSGVPNRIEEADDPTFTDLLQNKISGQHLLGKIKVDWNLARTSVERKEKDLTIVNNYATFVVDQYKYFTGIGNFQEPRYDLTSRQNYHNREMNYTWDAAATIPFMFGKLRHTLKAGYFGMNRKAKFDWQIAAFTNNSLTFADSLRYLSVADMQKPENIGLNGFLYSVNPAFLDFYEGESRTHAGYLMFDNHLTNKVRLVWGIRGEYYKYNEIKNGTNSKFSIYSIKPDPRWQWLPSANLTYSPLNTLNLRAAFSSSVVRPELMDNSQFFRYRPDLGGQYGNQGLYSTRINSWDAKAEWFPGVGEIISVGGFYKNFDKPAELNINLVSGNYQYYLKSADWAKVYGLEIEVRKTFGMFGSSKMLNNLIAYGNLTLQRSEVKSTFTITNPDPAQPPLEVTSKLKRYMYGQSPYLVNAGLQYTGDHLGFNFMFNQSGYKTYIVGSDPTQIEYERPRGLLDAQVSYRFLKKRFEIRLNAGNILNAASTFYRNTASYEPNPDRPPGAGDNSDAFRLKSGYSNKYEDGDLILFSQKFGRTYSTTLTYNF